MRIIVENTGLVDLPSSAADFLDVGWAPPDADGVRAVRELDAVGVSALQRLCEHLSDVLRDPDRVIHDFQVRIQEDGYAFAYPTETWYRAPDRATKALAEVYNERRDLVTCHTCGSIFVPERRRAARFCSPRCRNEWHQREVS